jgi:RNA polymerase sigma factor (sigma-70 family)
MTAPGPAADMLRQLHALAAARRHEEVPDAQLLDAFTAGRDEAAFAALVRRHGPMVLAVCRRLLPAGLDAEDVFQATFLTLARRAAAIRKRGSVACWLHGVARRLALKARATARSPRPVPVPPPGPADPLDLLTARELLSLLDEELGRLPERWRAPLVLCYLEEKTHQEAARLLGCPVGTLRSRLQRGKELLRGRLARRGVRLTAAVLAATLAETSARAAVSAAAALTAARAVTQFVAGRGAGGALSARAVSLSTEVLHAMYPSKLPVVAVVLLVVGALGGGAALLGRAAPAPDPEKPPAEAAPPPASGGPLAETGQRPASATVAAADPAKPAPPARARRVQRWALDFGTDDGEESARQLQALGAVVAVPEANDKGRYRVFRDLTKRPVRGEGEDLTRIDRLFWIDSSTASVTRLARALGIAPVPEHVVVFFPEFVESELLRKELAFAGRRDEDITETRFKIRRTGTGYAFEVVRQTGKDTPVAVSPQQENERLRERLRQAEAEVERLRRRLDAVKKAVNGEPTGRQ